MLDEIDGGCSYTCIRIVQRYQQTGTSKIIEARLPLEIYSWEDLSLISALSLLRHYDLLIGASLYLTEVVYHSPIANRRLT